MNDRASLIGTAVTWLGSITYFMVHNLNALLGVVALAVAIAASWSTVRLNRMKRRYLEAADERACEACRAGDPKALCPYPVHKRPANCKHHQKPTERQIP